jgi:ectoine hydroxylase-related dioxygenase (phytanoyl-CoA dioxygenase family)
MATAQVSEIAEEIQRKGYVVLEDAFDSTEIDEMRAEADRMLELIVNSSIANDRTSGRLVPIADEGGNQMIKKIQPINDLSLLFTELSRDERITEPMREVMDDEPRLMEEKLNYKQPLPEPVPALESRRPTTSFPIHSDWAYYKAQDYPQATMSAAIAIDELTAENGTMRFWPGTNDEFVEHERTDNGLEVPPDQVEEADAELIEADAGALVLFDSIVWHDSSPNDTEEPRRLMIYSHYPSSVGQERNIVEDERNAPSRRNESPYEWEYQKLKDAGEFEDTFEAPTVV